MAGLNFLKRVNPDDRRTERSNIWTWYGQKGGGQMDVTTSAKKVEEIREYYPGFVGGKEVAEKATDEEIIWLVRWGNEAAHLVNKCKEIEQLQNNLIRGIKERRPGSDPR